MYQKFEQLNEDLLSEAENILDDMGLDTVTVVRMMLKRIIKERDISFILSKKDDSTPIRKSAHISQNSQDEPIKMTKTKAVSLFKNHGIQFVNNNITFASKNKSAYNYWANPDFIVLDHDWYLILNDRIRQEIHLFVVPQGSIRKTMLVARGDMKNKIDLQIMYDDASFTDTRSKVSFSRYLKETVKY